VHVNDDKIASKEKGEGDKKSAHFTVLTFVVAPDFNYSTLTSD